MPESHGAFGRAPTATSGWRVTPALTGTVLTAVALLPLAVALRRPDLVVLAGGLLAAVAWPLRAARHRSGRPMAVALRVPGAAALEGQTVPGTVEIDSDLPLDLARVQLRHDRRVELSGGPAERGIAGDGATDRVMTFEALTVRWGRSTIGPVGVVLTSALGMLRHTRLDTGFAVVTTLPLRELFTVSDLVPHAGGVVGGHRSRRTGEGSELTTVRPFVSGDRLHRITWPVSTRTGRLHVVATVAERDTVVTLVLDNAAVVNGRDTAGRPTGSVDIAVRAAATLGEHYLRQGDRVGLIDLGSTVRPVRARAGRAHLMALLDVLLDTEQRRTGRDAEVERLLLAVPPRSLVMMFSTLLDDRATAQAVVAARTGHPVVVIDTLPVQPELEQRSAFTDLAWRVTMLQREATVERLATLGIPVVAWRGHGSLDEVLRDLSRMAAAPKALR